MDRKRKLENDLTGKSEPKRQSRRHSHGYEVFLSFMGEDTRKGFTDHLYQQMVDAGISVFKDNVNLPFGGEISTNLSKGIEMSKIAMPILSKNYAASRWCLDELVCMLECRKTRKQTVLPIFYDVTPSQVRYQTGSYADAFSGHANKYDEETREKWRKALAEVTSLKGLELEKETGGHEGQLTKKILGKVLVELKKTHLRVTDKLVGIDDQEKAVKDLLAIDTKDVRKVVGLWGMGGIGKTTLAKFIYNQILDKFESCSFLGDIREKSLEHNGLALLQSRLVSDLSRQERRDFSSVDEGVNELEHMFHEKKVLILLDDVDNIDQLEALAANINWFGPGSRIIVTTRDRSIMDDLLGLADDDDIAQECGWACYEVKEMNKMKALQLFCNHAFRHDSPEDELSVLSHAIVETTGGLPLALEVIGSYLSRKRKLIWEETLEKLRKMPKLEVQERLKISYERLDDDQKQMFLEVACLFIGEDIDSVMHVWKDRSFSAETGKDALLVMSLIKIVDNKIWMHDQLRDLGKEIVRKENYKGPGKRITSWQEDEAIAAIANNSMVNESSSEVGALHLWNDSNEDNYITSEDIRNYPNLWFLKLYGLNLTGEFRHVLSRLRWLSWYCSSKECPPTNINLEKLLFLDLSFSCTKGDGKLWSSFQSSTKLKVLKLTCCLGLITLDVSMFINLESLVLDKCRELKEISAGKLNCRGLGKQASFFKFKSLRILKCLYCENLQEIKGLDQLKALQELDLSGCTRLLPNRGSWTKLQGFEKLDQLEALQELNLYACTMIEKLPSLSKLESLKMRNCGSCRKLQEIEGLDQLEALQELNLYACIKIEKLPSLSKLKSLKRLNFGSCSKLQEIEDLDQLEVLQELNLSGCRSIKKLPNLSKLKSLKILNCGSCSKLQEIEGLDQLEALEELNLCMCITIEKLPSLSKLKSLKMFNCGSCSKLQEIEGLDQLEALQELNLSMCITIEKLPSLSKLKSLKMLNCGSCSKLQEIEGLDQLEALQVLNLSGCTSIEKLPNLSKLKSLKMLDCGSCSKLQEIEGLDQLEELQKLNLSGCTSIEKLSNLSKLKSLKILDCGSCSKLQEIEGLDQLEALQVLNLSGRTSIEKLSSLSKLKYLKMLNCGLCSNLQEIEGLDQLEALPKLNLFGCTSIEKLPNLSKLKSLKMLDCGSCSKLQEIEGLDQLEALQELNLSGCTSIEKLSSLSKLKSLKMLDCGSCSKLQEIEGLDQLEALQVLNLSGCTSIEKLPNLSKLKSLKMLDCGSCSKLQEIEGLDPLEALQELNLSGCTSIEKLSNLSKLKSLKKLDCDSCSKLQEIEGLDQLEALQKLNLYMCITIEKLPIFSKLKSLKMLDSRFCVKLQDIEGLDQLKALQEVRGY